MGTLPSHSGRDAVARRYNRRLAAFTASGRLSLLATELSRMAAEDQQQRVERVSWPGAPYLQYVDSKYHARLLVMAGLGLLPFEIETGRWAGQPRHERMCRFGCGVIGELTHFLRHCRALTSACVMSLDRYDAAGRTDTGVKRQESLSADGENVQPCFGLQRTNYSTQPIHITTSCQK